MTNWNFTMFLITHTACTFFWTFVDFYPHSQYFVVKMWPYFLTKKSLSADTVYQPQVFCTCQFKFITRALNYVSNLSLILLLYSCRDNEISMVSLLHLDRFSIVYLCTASSLNVSLKWNWRYESLCIQCNTAQMFCYG